MTALEIIAVTVVVYIAGFSLTAFVASRVLHMCETDTYCGSVLWPLAAPLGLLAILVKWIGGYTR